MTEQEIHGFQQTVWEYFGAHGRHDLPWRQPEADGAFDPYKILVSELMLQQTQVARVIPKYAEFLRLFPTVSALANAELGEVLVAWQGLGYNRRAKFLWQAAQKVMQDYHGAFPESQAELVSLPGVGTNTAGAIMAYAFNAPAAFIETNVRTVYIHHFFGNQADIPDKAIATLVEQTVDNRSPREWYWALMDYGTFLKQTVGNLSRYSKSYARQSKFEGSLRQVRGAVIRALSVRSRTLDELTEEIGDERLSAVLQSLETENMIRRTATGYSLFQI